MATTYTTTVKPSGGDYTSLSAWEAGFGSNTGSHNGNLVTADAIEHAELYAMDDTSVVVIAGWTTDSTRYIKIQPAAGEGHDGKWNAAKYRITSSGWAAVIINNQQGYTRLIGIQCHHSGGGSSSKGIVNPGYAGTIIDSCIVRKSSTATGEGFSVYGAATGDAPVVVNSVVYGGWYVGFNVSASGGAGFSYAYNCTSYGNTLGYRGFYEQRLKNCIGASNTTADFARDGSYPVIQTNCASTDGTADDFTPTNCRVSQTFSFVDPANGDFHLQSSDAGAKDYGTDLSGDSIYPFSTDIDGETRSGTWDIGADEYIAGGGGSALLKIYNEAVNSTSGNPRLMGMKRPVAETQSLTEGTLRRRGLLRVLGETVSLVGAALRRSALVRLVSSVISISEGAVKSISALLVRVITGTVQAAEGEARRLFLSRHAGEEIAVTEGVARRGFLRRVLNGSTAITEGVLKASALVRAIGDGVSLVGAAIRKSTLVRLAASTVQAAESTGPVRGFVRVVSEAMSVAEGVVRGAVAALGTLSDNLSVVFRTVRRGVSSISRKRGALSRSHNRGVKS